MKMAMKDGRILIREANSVQSGIIKSWGKMKLDKTTQTFSGLANVELLDKLAGLVNLPPPIEEERKRKKAIAKAVDRERVNPEPIPLIDPPIRTSLFAHQVRGYNMALMIFELIAPPKGVM